MSLQYNKKVVILNCVNYPFSHGEHLLEEEIKHHLKNFNKVILVSADTKTPQQYHLDPRVTVLRYVPKVYWKDGLLHFGIIFHLMMCRELLFVLRNFKPKDCPKLIKRALIAYIQSKKYQVFFSKVLEDLGPEKFVFYSWWITNATLGFCFMKEKHPNLKIYSRARAVDLYLYRHSPPYLPFRNYIFEKLNQVFTISNEGKQYICDHFRFLDHSKIQVSHIGVLGEGNLPKYNIRKPLTLVSCSGVIPLKRLDYIIDSLTLINDCLIHWIHFGDGPELKNMRDYAYDTLTGKTNISYDFKGHYANDKLRGFYRSNQVDLFINLSQFEGVPVAIMEAFSFGIPAIATNVGGVKEMVNKTNGFLIDVEKAPASVSAAISDFYHLDLQKKQEYRNNAHSTWKEKFNLNKNFSALSRTIAGITE